MIRQLDMGDFEADHGFKSSPQRRGLVACSRL